MLILFLGGLCRVYCINRAKCFKMRHLLEIVAMRDCLDREVAMWFIQGIKWLVKP